ncbi:tyrosine-type recombinase/integrase [Chamaesiphon sp. VAR_48_metabat_403]|uniref:tyrosine-type recombinase/integrase n=1 Tax=Chamaesiphon sp. VAR_48_metabat_403 TaxID=2964700 RepID=UPI00286D9A1F|nr:tyrosine-type recombinase/integrase [Chamaesiphon sp. VAR_48_metabat_403]
MKVTIETKKTGHLLRWVCPQTGKRVSISVNEASDGRNPTKLKDRIENDIKHGEYDPTLVKYRPKTIGKNKTELTTVELFDRFTQHQIKEKRLSKSSIDTRYKYTQRMLEKHLNIPAYQLDRQRVESFLDVCWDALKPNTAKTRIWLLKAAWDWGRGKCELPDLNPWDGVAERFKSVPVQPVPAFSKDEVRKILDGFRTSPHYANYLDYVRFRMSMATRPQEVRDLKWKHISADFESVWFVSNKTKKGRTVPLDPSIASMLRNKREREARHQGGRVKPVLDEELVFTSREGLPIDNRNFRRLWIIVLAEAGVPYRKPYTTRKTSVRHSLLSGANYIEVAAAAGHDPHTMHKYYGDAIQQNSVLKAFE